MLLRRPLLRRLLALPAASAPLVLGLAAFAPLLLVACGDDEGAPADGAALDVLVEPEDVITSGLSAGDGLEDVRDGWSVSFDKYVVALGGVELRLTTDTEQTADAHELYAVDLTRIEASGEVLWSFTGLEDGRWDLGYVISAHDFERHDTVSEGDFDRMSAEHLSALITGQLIKEDGVSCPPTALAMVPDGAEQVGENAGGDACFSAPLVSFEIAVGVEAAFGPCEVDGLTGVALTSGRTSTVALTIHGDHLFFNGFPEGSEGGAMRLAQWLADSDLNLDGAVDSVELAAIAPSDLPEFDERFQLGGSPLTPLDDLLTYVEAQLMTQGHIQGEGECGLSGETPGHEH